MRHLGVCFLVLAVTAGSALAASKGPSTYAREPHGYWLGPIHGPVPATIAGGTVIDTAALAKLLKNGGAVLVDVAEAPHRPVGLPAGSLWLPPPHRDIAGSVWIPDVGRGAISPGFEAWFQKRLAELTGGNRDKRIVVYCHPRCWMSWNAAKRAINDGYRAVYWYPEGLEGWDAAGQPTSVTNPEGPDAR